MRRLLYGVPVALFLLSPLPALAQAAVVCVNCATEPTAAAQLIKDFEQLTQQIQIAENTIATYENLVINTENLPGRLFADITSPIRVVQGLVQQASLLSNNAKFMLDNLGYGGGWGGSLADIPAALAQEDNALSMAARQLGLANQQLNIISATCATQHAAGADGSFGSVGIHSAIQGGTEITATSGQCAEARMQLQAAGFQTIVTAELRRADRESMIAAKVQQDRSTAIASACSQLTAITTAPVCTQQPGPGVAAGVGGAIAPAATPLPGGGAVSGVQAEAINAAPASAANNVDLAAAVNAAPVTP